MMTDDVGEHEEVAEESLAEGDGVARIPTSISLVPRRLELLPFPFHASSLDQNAFVDLCPTSASGPFG